MSTRIRSPTRSSATHTRLKPISRPRDADRLRRQGRGVQVEDRRDRQLLTGYLLGIASYLVGLALSVVTDLSSSSVIVWAMALLGLFVLLASGYRQSGVPKG